jgi:hypothetical protein
MEEDYLHPDTFFSMDAKRGDSELSQQNVKGRQPDIYLKVKPSS